MRKIAGIIALIAIMGLVASCGGGGGSSTTPGGTETELTGTYYSADGRTSFTFTGKNITVMGYEGSMGVPVASATYVRNGNEGTVTITEILHPEFDGFKAGDVFHFTIINDTTLRSTEWNETLTKR